MIFRQLFLRENQVDDLLELLQKQDNLPESLEDVRRQLSDMRSAPVRRKLEGCRRGGYCKDCADKETCEFSSAIRGNKE